jgi:hypothetical protein
MAKTVFSNGVKVLSAWLNSVYSHVHDGVDSDGHCSKIDLASAAQVTGELPFTNILWPDIITIDMITATGFVTPIEFSLSAIKYKKLVVLMLTTTDSGTSNTNTLEAVGNGSSPEITAAWLSIKPKGSNYLSFPGFVNNNGVYIPSYMFMDFNNRILQAQIPKKITVSPDDVTGYSFYSDVFTASGSKGFLPFSHAYIGDN